MNRQRRAKTSRWMISPVVLSLLVWIIGALVWGSAPAQAATVDSSLSIVVYGTVTEPDGSTILIGGYVTVSSTAVQNTLGILDRVVLTFDYSNVYAVDSGPGKKSTYVTGGFKCIKIRALAPSDTLPITCPYFKNTAGILSADSWLVTATVYFDSTGKLSSGSATVGNNPY